MTSMHIDVWLYGPLARYGGDPSQKVFANLPIELEEGSSVSDLLKFLQMPSKERGITFINGELSALPEVQLDLDRLLNDGDRVAFFHLQSMWPYQYRFGAPATDEILSGQKISSTGKPKE